jgi:hypothetical protein
MDELSFGKNDAAGVKKIFGGRSAMDLFHRAIDPRFSPRSWGNSVDNTGTSL